MLFIASSFLFEIILLPQFSFLIPTSLLKWNNHAKKMFSSWLSLWRSYESSGWGHSVSQATNSGWKEETWGQNQKALAICGDSVKKSTVTLYKITLPVWRLLQSRPGPATGSWNIMGEVVHAASLSLLICGESAVPDDCSGTSQLWTSVIALKIIFPVCETIRAQGWKMIWQHFDMSENVSF